MKKLLRPKLSSDARNPKWWTSDVHHLGFTDRVHLVVSAIPRGKTMTYAQVAAAAGSPRACRAVGTILSHNYDPHIPCHRVIRSDGMLGQYNRGTARKKRLLEQEGAI